MSRPTRTLATVLRGVFSDSADATIPARRSPRVPAALPSIQFQAFAVLVAEGRPVEDIAADFGVAPLVVQRRLKLANVSPRLLADYRAGEEVSLEQLMALAITDDHAAQEVAFYESPEWQRSPGALRDHLTRDVLSASGDALARFIGIEACEAAQDQALRVDATVPTRGCLVTVRRWTPTESRARIKTSLADVAGSCGPALGHGGLQRSPRFGSCRQVASGCDDIDMARRRLSSRPLRLRLKPHSSVPRRVCCRAA